ncbi:tRNA threonylcarbamoyladenosine dehydratase [Thermoanaerobacterium sp. RBIITD]|uniref:tRNA threonylcarbamoyladenosine dehydratase n=1 Tax=Thermoanaerobacterium sp. RBIITD TaxID=1550240 RepID=UPI000BB76A2E
MLHAFSRTELIIGKENLDKLKESTVAVFGMGGVGSYTAEALIRCGIGKLIIVDDDTVCLTNINRQLHATRKTVGRPKVDVMKERLNEINPKAEVIAYQTFYNSEKSNELLSPDYDYVVDAVDTVSAKIDLVVKCNAMGIPIISCMGAANKLDPTKFEVADIYETSICPLAKVMRYELRRRGIKSLKVVYSKEKPIMPLIDVETCKQHCICTNKVRTCAKRRQIPGSISFVPPVAGFILAGEVIKDLIGYNNK